MVLIFTALFFCPAQAFADAALLGFWTSFKLVGSPCNELIKEVKYSFHKNGEYEIHSKMYRPFGVREESAAGTYQVRNGEIIGRVQGVTVGPFRYQVKDDILVLTERSPTCEIHLKKEDD